MTTRAHLSDLIARLRDALADGARIELAAAPGRALSESEVWEAQRTGARLVVRS